MSVARPRRPAPARTASLARITLLGLACTALSPVAAEESSAWRLSGFGTAGITTQSGADGWGFMRNSGQLGAGSSTSASQDSRLGLQLNWTSSATWAAAIQAVAESKPSDTPMAERIEWAYLSLRPLADSHIRLGRTSPGIFLFSDSRNVGYALPWARPPVDFYGFAIGSSVDGLDVEQRWSNGDAMWRLRLTGGSSALSLADNRQGTRTAVHGRDTLALSLTHEDGGLLLRASYLHARSRLDAPPELLVLRDGLTQLAALPVPGLAEAVAPLQRNLWAAGPVSYAAVGLQHDTGPWTLIAEASSLAVPDSPFDEHRGYASLAYRHRNISYYALVSRVRPRQPAPLVPDLAGALSPVIGPQAAAGAQQLVDAAGSISSRNRHDQSTVGLGLRWDMLSQAALKLQIDRFHVHPNGSAGWYRADARAARGTLVSVLVDFVWGQ